MVHGNTHFGDLKGHPRGVVEKEADDDRLMQHVCVYVCVRRFGGGGTQCSTPSGYVVVTTVVMKTQFN